VSNITFYILSPLKIEAYEHNQLDFIADDVMYAIQMKDTKIATDRISLENLKKEYPNYNKYEVKVGKI
jgi:hypothetical protein